MVTAITPAVVVAVFDFYGNPVSDGKQVTMTIQSNPGNGTLTGGGPVGTSGGTSTFSNLKINNPAVSYVLRATVPTTDTVHVPGGSVTADSTKFDVANQVAQNCSGTCTATGTVTNNTTSTITANVTSGAALRLSPSAAAAAGNVLGAIVTTTLLPPAGVCGTNGVFGNQLGAAGTAADFVTTVDKATFTVVTRIDKSIVKKKPQPNGASSFDVCLGAQNKNNPPSAGHQTPCVNGATDPSFPKKGGGCAVFNNSTGFDFVWGLLPDVPNGVKSCTSSKVKFPAVLSKTKNGAGDVILTYCVPDPWDPHGFTG